MTAPSPVYVAPSTEPLTCLHVRDPLALNRDLDSDGVTACERALLHREIWQVVDKRPGDRVCPACLGEPEAEADDGALF